MEITTLAGGGVRLVFVENGEVICIFARTQEEALGALAERGAPIITLEADHAHSSYQDRNDQPTDGNHPARPHHADRGAPGDFADAPTVVDPFADWAGL